MWQYNISFAKVEKIYKSLKGQSKDYASKQKSLENSHYVNKYYGFFYAIQDYLLQEKNHKSIPEKNYHIPQIKRKVHFTKSKAYYARQQELQLHGETINSDYPPIDLEAIEIVENTY